MKLTRATIPMCPECGAELEPVPLGWECPCLHAVDDNNLVWGYHAPDIEGVVREGDASSQVLEDIKVALRRPGTDRSYVEWAKECRDSMDRKPSGDAREVAAELRLVLENDTQYQNGAGNWCVSVRPEHIERLAARLESLAPSEVWVVTWVRKYKGAVYHADLFHDLSDAQDRHDVLAKGVPNAMPGETITKLFPPTKRPVHGAPQDGCLFANTDPPPSDKETSVFPPPREVWVCMRDKLAVSRVQTMAPKYGNNGTFFWHKLPVHGTTTQDIAPETGECERCDGLKKRIAIQAANLEFHDEEMTALKEKLRREQKELVRAQAKAHNLGEANIGLISRNQNLEIRAKVPPSAPQDRVARLEDVEHRATERALITALEQDLTLAKKVAARYLRACRRIHLEWRNQAHVSRACLFGDCVPIEQLDAANARIEELENAHAEIWAECNRYKARVE